MASTHSDPLSVDGAPGGAGEEEKAEGEEERAEGEEEKAEGEEEKAAEWSRGAQVPVKVLRAHSAAVTAARLCFSDSCILSCSSDHRAILWVNLLDSQSPVELPS